MVYYFWKYCFIYIFMVLIGVYVINLIFFMVIMFMVIIVGEYMFWYQFIYSQFQVSFIVYNLDIFDLIIYLFIYGFLDIKLREEIKGMFNGRKQYIFNMVSFFFIVWCLQFVLSYGFNF